MIVKEHFDVIVVGTGLAPLLCASLLCKRGFRVLVVGDGSPEGDAVPSVTAELGSPLARRILSELGIAQIVRRKEQPVDPLLQIITPRCRVSVPRDRQRLLAEFARELPREREAARIFYTDLDSALDSVDRVLDSGLALPPRGFIESQRVRRLLASTTFGADGLGGRLLDVLAHATGLRSCVFAHVVPASRLDRRQIAPVHAALLHGRALSGQVAFEGGIKGLRELLLHRIATSRGETKLADRIEEIEVRHRRVVHVKLSGHESATGCDFLVAGVDLASLGRRVRQEGRRFREELVHGAELATAGYLATTRIVLRDEVFPEPMARLVYVLFDESAPPLDANLAVLERGPGPADGSEGLWISFILDAARTAREPGYVRGVTDEVMRRLRTVVPFLDGFIVEVIRPLEGVDRADVDEDPGQVLGRIMPPIYATPSPGPWSACGLGYTTRIRNLICCSHQVLPGLAGEGLWMAAWGASGLIARRDPGKARWKSRMKRL